MATRTLPPADQDAVVADFIEQVAAAVHPIQIWLFGSRARGDADEWSDVDLLVVLEPDTDRRACRMEVSRLEAKTGIRSDVLFTNADHIVRRGRVGGTVLNNALEEGLLVYEQEDAHAATALEWQLNARNSLRVASMAAAQLEVEPELAGEVSWGALQSLEKSIKAALFLEHVGVPRTHKLHELAELLPEEMQAWTAGMNLASTTYRGLGGRYPDWGPNPTVEEARRALSDAQRFYDQLVAELQRRGIR